MSLQSIADAIRNFPGVTRKNAIHEVVDLLPTKGFPHVAAAEGEDAAALDVGDQYVLFATDGIMESLLAVNPTRDISQFWSMSTISPPWADVPSEWSMSCPSWKAGYRTSCSAG